MSKRAASVNPSAGGRVAGIEDLILQILVRLPAKSLIRFKVVSKQWLSLISDPKFGQSHVLRNPSSPASGMFVDLRKPWKVDFFHLDGDTDRSRPSFDFIDKVFHEFPNSSTGKGHDEVRILQSCNGLFLCGSLKYSRLCVCNPTTKQYRFLPRIGGILTPVSGLGLAFDPSISPHYSVVSEKYNNHLGSRSWVYRVEVYSSKDHQWRLLLELKESKANAANACGGGDGVFYDGGIHWIGHHSFHFDLKSECLVQRRRPQWKNPGVLRPDWHAGVRDKYIYKTPYHLRKLYVSEMTKDYCEWVLKHIICVRNLTSAYPEIVTSPKRFNYRQELGFAASALGVVEGVKDEDAVLLLAIPDKIISYNIVHETVKTVYYFPAEPAEKTEIEAFPFIETLSPV